MGEYMSDHVINRKDPATTGHHKLPPECAELALANIGQPVAVLDRSARVLWRNDAFAGQFSEGLVGRCLSEHLPEVTADTLAGLSVARPHQVRLSGQSKYREATLTLAADNAVVLTLQAPVEKARETATKSRESLITREILSSIPQHVFWKDRDLAYLGCNENFARVAGLDAPEDIVGKCDYDLPWTREESDWYRKCDRDVMDQGDALINIEETQTRADGSVTTVLTSKVPLKDPRGEVIGILGLYADITQLKEAEQKVRDSEARYDELFSSVQEGIGLLNADEEVEYCNPAFARIFGVDAPVDLVGKDLHELFAEDQREILRAQSAIRETGTSSRYELRLDLDNGQARHLLVTVTPRLNGDEMIGTFGAVLDITERKRAEAALHSNLHFMQTLLDTIPNPVFYIDLTGRVRGCNAAMAEGVIHASADTIVGKPLADYLPEIADPKALIHGEDSSSNIDAARLHRRDCRLTFGDGTEHDVVLSTAVFRDADDQPAGLVGVINDVTELKAIQKALNDTVRRYTAMINTVPAAMYVKDRKLRYITVNDSFLGMVGKKEAEVTGRTFDEVCDASLSVIFNDNDAEVLRDGTAIHQKETSMMGDDGQRRWYSNTRIPLFNAEGKMLGL
ncbi:PAS domain-containing protein, partial [candidate division GN15 bacterium]|nr:PAS domain-containing protein [candidate division GN15 bacterium]